MGHEVCFNMLRSNSVFKINQTVEETYPASKRTRWEILEELHNQTNWYDVEHDGWRLPANEEPHDWCGSWQTKGCLNVEGHVYTEYCGKIYIKTYQRSCYRASCEKCHIKWIAREANKATKRIQKYEEISGKNAKHVIISPPIGYIFLLIKN